jgi:hypothetical protein
MTNGLQHMGVSRDFPRILEKQEWFYGNFFKGRGEQYSSGFLWLHCGESEWRSFLPNDKVVLSSHHVIDSTFSRCANPDQNPCGSTRN